LPQSYKDEVVDAAVRTIREVSERKALYFAKHGQGRKTRRPKLSNLVYERNDREEAPQIIRELNENLKAGLSENAVLPTVEDIALKVGITRSMLYGWIRNDPEFVETLKRLKMAQENDAFKTGTAEDNQVNTMVITLLLMGKLQSKSHYS
jgi:hypothetical protein